MVEWFRWWYGLIIRMVRLILIIGWRRLLGGMARLLAWFDGGNGINGKIWLDWYNVRICIAIARMVELVVWLNG